jgi:hypothetical protein
VAVRHLPPVSGRVRRVTRMACAARLYHQDVVRFLIGDDELGVLALGMQGVSGDHASGQVQRFGQRTEPGDVGSAERRGASLGWSFSVRPPSEPGMRVFPHPALR